jgi:hypothetical protein
VGKAEFTTEYPNSPQSTQKFIISTLLGVLSVSVVNYPGFFGEVFTKGVAAPKAIFHHRDAGREKKSLFAKINSYKYLISLRLNLQF